MNFHQAAPRPWARHHRLAVAALIGSVLCLVLAVPALAQTYPSAPGWAASDYATALPSDPWGVAFDGTGNLFVTTRSGFSGALYKFGNGGGAASVSTLVSTYNAVRPSALAFGKDGRLYLATTSLTAGASGVVEVDPTTGAVLRTVAGMECAFDMVTDPLSGDLFTSPEGDGGCPAAITRIANPASNSPTVSTYATLSSVPSAMAIAADGTLFATVAPAVAKVSGTNGATPGTVTMYPAFTGSLTNGAFNGIGVATNPADPANPPFLLISHQNGVVSKADLTTNPATVTDVVTGAWGGNGVGTATVDASGCFYPVSITNLSVIRVSNSDGTCPALTPGTVAKPPAVVPEVGAAVLLPLTALVVIVPFALTRRRRRTADLAMTLVSPVR